MVLSTFRDVSYMYMYHIYRPYHRIYWYLANNIQDIHRNYTRLQGEEAGVVSRQYIDVE